MAQQLKSRRWMDILTPVQQKTYASAIRKGYFATFDGLRWKHEFYGAFLWKYPGRVPVIDMFRSLIGRAPLWEDITDDNLRDLKEDLDNSYSPNSVRTICAEINSVIRENSASKQIPSLSFATVLRARKVVSQSVFLTDDEIRLLHEYQPRTLRRRHAKRMFMLECLCGARHSDCLRLSPDNLSSDGRTITYVAQKTNHEVTVPVHPWLRGYLVPTSPDEPQNLTVAAYNTAIRDFCKACGIDKSVKVFHGGRERRGPKYSFVSTHTGRRSFATNLSLKNVPLEQIALMMGHFTGNAPDIAMTQRYIITRLQLSPAAFQAFSIPGAERAEAEQLAYSTPSGDFDDFDDIDLPDDENIIIPERPQVTLSTAVAVP